MTDDDERRIDALCARLAQHRDVYLASLDYPPATEAQLRATEQQLGYPLPPFLRAFYGLVANGGACIGPGWALYGAEGGCAKGYGEEQGTVGALVSRSGWRLHPRIADVLLQHPGRYALSDSCPEGFLEFGCWGCGTSVEVDLTTGRVYLTGPWGELWNANNESEWLVMIELVAPSLEDWFERWLDGTFLEFLSQSKEGPLAREDVELPGGAEAVDAAAVWKGLYWIEQPDEPTELAAPEDSEISGWD